MPILHIVVLALVQGVTEFLPISSSAHLVLVPVIAGWPDQGPIVDVAVHVGTLGAVMVYFWRDLFAMVAGIYHMLLGRRDPNVRLVGWVIVATLPVIVAGFAMNHYFPDGLRSIKVIAWATLGFGIVLYLADKLGMTMRRVEHLGLSDAVVIGLAQVLALIPGTSRSGITISAARILGMERSEAARFSMLISMPTILGAGILKGLDLYKSGDAALTQTALIAVGLSFVSAFISLSVMMLWIRRSTFSPFVVYRILLGVGLLAVTYGWLA